MSTEPNNIPWVSFCMSTRRRPEMLIKTLRSIQRQTFPDFEVVVCDNDTEGSAGAVVASLKDSRFHHHVNEKDLGMNAGFNRSLSKARGKYVVMITDDDPIYPEMLEILKDLSEKYPGYGAYYGGCDLVQTNPEIAKLTLHKVGANSCLAPLPLDTVRTYTREQFPHAFFGGELDMYLLWSVGMAKREIAQGAGMPTYASTYLGDFVHTASACSEAGCVVINRAVGTQIVHETNWGHDKVDIIKTAVLGLHACMEKRLGNRPDWPEIKPKVEKFLGNWVMMHCLFLHQYARKFNLPKKSVDAAIDELFSIPFIRPMRRLYRLGGLYIRIQQKQAEWRQGVANRMKKK